MNLDDIINSMMPEVYQRLCVDRGTKRELPATGDAVASPP